MKQEELIEQLADKEHASWARWMKYLFEKCEEYYDGDGYEMLAIPRELVTHWKRQVATPYSELSEREKQSDREEVKHILPIIEEYKADKAGSLLNQADIVLHLAHIQCAIDRLNTEVFSISITDEKTRQTLLGRVDELSGMAALGPVDQSFFLE